MEAFFSGTVLILYFLSRYAAEPIFVAACFLPALGGAAAMLSLRCGGAGRMRAAWHRLGRYRRHGVIAGGDRAAFYARCVKGTPPAYRAAYSLFLQGKTSASELSLVGIRCASTRKGFVPFAVGGVGLIAALLVFLTFYFSVPIGETLLRTAIVAFQGAIHTLSCHVLSYYYVARAEKAASRFSESVDDLLLRDRAVAVPASRSLSSELPDHPSSSFARRESRAFRSPDPMPKASSTSSPKGVDPERDRDLRALKAMLRELSESKGGA